MLIHPTIDNMKTLKLFAMVRTLETQMEIKDIEEMNFTDRLGLLVDAELIARENKRLQSRLSTAKLRLSACIEDLDIKANRGLDRTVIASLATSEWLKRHQNIIITGLCGAGKTYVACALAQRACRDGYTVIYERAPKLFQDLALAKADGRYHKIMTNLAKKDLIIIDDFALAPLTDEQRRDLLEIVEERYDRRSTMMVSQVPTNYWHDIIGDPTIADAILDRLIHNAHKLALKGKTRRKPPDEETEDYENEEKKEGDK